MIDGEPKIPPIEPLYFYLPHQYLTRMQVTPEDFIHLVLGKRLTVIRRKEPKDWLCYYLALDSGIMYYTRSKTELIEIPVDFEVPSLGLWKGSFK